MKLQNRNPFANRILLRQILLAVIVSIFNATGGMPLVYAQTMQNDTSAQVYGYVLSNGQFVYGPNVGDFDLKTYLQTNAPHLLKYADDLYGRSEYFSINPKVYLTLFELHNGLVSNPDTNAIDDPFGLYGAGFISQVEDVSQAMFDAYYLHLYNYSALFPSQRTLSSFTTIDNGVVNVDSSVNAGTYAIIASLSRFETEQRISLLFENNYSDGFYQTYKRLFGEDDPLDETNYIYVPDSTGPLFISKNYLQVSEPTGRHRQFLQIICFNFLFFEGYLGNLVESMITAAAEVLEAHLMMRQL